METVWDVSVKNEPINIVVDHSLYNSIIKSNLNVNVKEEPIDVEEFPVHSESNNMSSEQQRRDALVIDNIKVIVKELQLFLERNDIEMKNMQESLQIMRKHQTENLMLTFKLLQMLSLVSTSSSTSTKYDEPTEVAVQEVDKNNRGPGDTLECSKNSKSIKKKIKPKVAVQEDKNSRRPDEASEHSNNNSKIIKDKIKKVAIQEVDKSNRRPEDTNEHSNNISKIIRTKQTKPISDTPDVTIQNYIGVIPSTSKASNTEVPVNKGSQGQEQLEIQNLSEDLGGKSGSKCLSGSSEDPVCEVSIDDHYSSDVEMLDENETPGKIKGRRSIERGKCNMVSCSCLEYEVSRSENFCAYCGHIPILHTELTEQRPSTIVEKSKLKSDPREDKRDAEPPCAYVDPNSTNIMTYYHKSDVDSSNSVEYKASQKFIDELLSRASTSDSKEQIVLEESYIDSNLFTSLPTFSSFVLPYLLGDNISETQKSSMRNIIIETIIEFLDTNNMLNGTSKVHQALGYRALGRALLLRYPNIHKEECTSKRRRKEELGFLMSRLADRRRVRKRRENSRKIN